MISTIVTNAGVDAFRVYDVDSGVITIEIPGYVGLTFSTLVLIDKKLTMYTGYKIYSIYGDRLSNILLELVKKNS